MKKLLIIDDSSYMRDVIKLFVSNLDIDVVGEAASGNEGVELYMQHNPDIVTLDLFMDDVNGLEALKRIMEHNPKTAVIVISSAAGQDPFINEATALGAKMFIKKPVDKNQLVSCISDLIDEA
jgi:two-component system chemotaxis response regulator CheY